MEILILSPSLSTPIVFSSATERYNSIWLPSIILSLNNCPYSTGTLFRLAIQFATCSTVQFLKLILCVSAVKDFFF